MEKVLLGMSGGVDSAAAAAILKSQGYEVTGLYLNTIGKDSNTREKLQFIQQRLNINIVEKDVREEFHYRVIEPFIRSYLSGLTPNPCIECNPSLKFSLLIEYADLNDISYISTGHYGRIKKEKGRYFIFRGRDRAKDQSYMLYRLDNLILERILFPLGMLYKEEVKELAGRTIGERIASRGESQDICFVRNMKLKEFLKDKAPQEMREGSIIDSKGRILGKHDGIFSYTIGQRKGLGLPGGPWYVNDIDPSNGTVRVGKRSDIYFDSIFCKDALWHEEPFSGEILQGQHRYNTNPFDLTVELISKDTFTVKCFEPVKAPSPGQAMVIYRGEKVLGGGTIESGKRSERS